MDMLESSPVGLNIWLWCYDGFQKPIMFCFIKTVKQNQFTYLFNEEPIISFYWFRRNGMKVANQLAKLTAKDFSICLKEIRKKLKVEHEKHERK